MKRTKLNLLAGMIMLVGMWTFTLPHPTSARALQERACCEDGDDQCCGDACRKTADGCEACEGIACIPFFKYG